MTGKDKSDHNIVVAINSGRPGTTTRVSSRQHVVQRSGRTTATTDQEEFVSENTVTPEELEQQDGE